MPLVNHIVTTTGGDIVLDSIENIVVVLMAVGLADRGNQLSDHQGGLYNRVAGGLYNRAGSTSSRGGGRSNNR